MWKNVKKIVDGNVTKFVFEKDDIAVEAVLYKYPTYDVRTVLCISTMCGCPMGCRFCGTGDYFVRALTAEEIVSQAEYILSGEIDGVLPVDIQKLQIMVMSMGEPALVTQLYPAFQTLYSKYSNAALLISTSAPDVDFQWITDMSIEIPTVGLQFSVHESTDAARDALIPFKKKMNLEKIAKTGESWVRAVGRKAYFNYCAHDGNVSSEDADRLLALFDPLYWESTVSVICERDTAASVKTNAHQRQLATDFSGKMLGRGYNVRVFDPSGQDTVGGGCGQLWHTQQWMSEHPEYVKKSCGYQKIKIHVPQTVK